MNRRCVGTPPPGYLSCPETATHWQIRMWGQGTPGGAYPQYLDLCEHHYLATLDRSDVADHGSN